MKRWIVLLAAAGLLLPGARARKAPVALPAATVVRDTLAWPDSLRAVRLTGDGLREMFVARDTAAARRLFEAALAADSAYAPAHYELGAMALFRDDSAALRHSRCAVALDSANKWYRLQLGQAQVLARRFDEALDTYRGLLRSEANASDPELYRVVALLHQQQGRPFSAIGVIDSAELRFGKLEPLSELKRRLLVETGQYDRAVEEARQLVETAPYKAQNHLVLGQLYARMGRDSLAVKSFDEAMCIDSTDLQTLAALNDFYSQRGDYRRALAYARRLFENDRMPLGEKVGYFERITSDVQFYQQYYFPINELASTLAIRYPREPQAVELYGQHLLATGDLEAALAYYKLHLEDRPPVQSYFNTVIDIESYLRRPDSVAHYVERAMTLWPDDVSLRLRKGFVLHNMGRYDEAIRYYRRTLRYAESDSLRGAIWGLIGDLYQQRDEQRDASRQESLATADSLLAEGIAALPAAAGATPETPERLAARIDSLQALLGGRRRSGSDLKRCYAAYEKALALYYDNASVLNNYAYFLTLEGRDKARALEMARRATQLVQNNPTFLDTYAWALFHNGALDEAKRTMQQALALDTNRSPELLRHYSLILAARGERFMADIYRQRADEATRQEAALRAEAEARAAAAGEAPSSGGSVPSEKAAPGIERPANPQNPQP